MIQARRFGPPDFFITITCSPDNEDLKNALNIALPDDKSLQQTSNFRPDLVARAFELIYKDFINLLSKTPEEIGFGQMVCYSAVNEWQMRGNPHGHTIWTLDTKDKIKTTEQLDKLIWAHIPDPHIYPELYALVVKFMLHGPCNQTSACWKKDRCSKHFPYEFCEKTSFNEEGNGKPKYARPNDGRYVEKKDMHSKKLVKLDNRYVVPYNPELLLRYRCHINVEQISSVLLFKYIHKYVQKGPSKAKVNVVEEKEEIDEIKEHLDVRVVSAQESFHRIFEFKLNRRSHDVIELKLHLEGQNKVYYMGKETAEEMIEKANKDTQLTGFMTLCRESTHVDFAKNLYYWQLPEHFSWKDYQWNATKLGTDVLENGKVLMVPDGSGKCYKKSDNLGMMYDVSPAQTELFHLRILLLHVKGPTSFEYLRTVNGIVYQTYQQACIERGLTTDDQEWHRCLTDAKDRFMPRRMRVLFVNILLHCNPCDPLQLWETFKDSLSEDYTHMLQETLNSRTGVRSDDSNVLPQEVQQLAYDKAYAEIAYMYFQEKGQEIMVLLNMPEPNMELNDLLLNLDAVSHAQIAEAMFESMQNNEEQKKFFLMIREEATSNNPRQTCFYLEGQAGTGKTFTYIAIFHDLMSKGKLVKTMASTGIAATLLPLGRTVHYTAGIYPPIHSKSITHLTKNSKKGKDLIESTLLIWDEAPMADRFLLEALDRSLQHLCNNKKPFGGKLIILGGDFRQCAPVVPEGSKSQIVGQSIKRSELWPLFSPPFVLTKNQRVNPDEVEFMDTLKTLGSGELQNGDEGYFDFPKACLSDDVITEVFGDCLHNKNYESMHDRVVLTPYNREADQINETILDLIEGEEKIYTSVDTLSRDNNLQVTEHYSTEVLNSTNLNNLPKHELRLKVHAIIMLIINLNASQALCNGTRLQITELKDNVIQGKHISGDNKGEIVYIPRTDKMSDDKKLPFKFNRHQFPVKLAFAMTINKSQGQTFSYVGLYLLNDVFTHGQLYVAASRVRKVMDLKIQLDFLREHDSVKNVVYKELLLD